MVNLDIIAIISRRRPLSLYLRLVRRIEFLSNIRNTIVSLLSIRLSIILLL